MRRPVARLKALWSGELPLRHAFWDYAVFWGVLINVAASALSVGVLLATRHVSAADAVAMAAVPMAVALHFAPLPYNLVALVGVWRSAAHPTVPFAASTVARAATIVLFTLFMVI